MTIAVSSDTENPSPTASGRAHPAFELRRSETIPSLNLQMEEYVHRKTGALHYHMKCDYQENVFLVAFRTVPADSTGVAHILEHTALCGSEKYPVRDPFFMMVRRSLNTFMNAFTSSDWTAYPFASKNRKDFDNLLRVYLDAAFFSRLDEMDFLQEGHRLEFAEPENPDSELQFKGVVYNEMKGAMSSANSVLWRTMCRYLYPTTTYHYNSGGEPDHIPDLSYRDLVAFYKSHYHPSNAVFMTFGDIPVSELHEQFEELALGRFEKLEETISVGDEKRYLAPVRIEESYAVEGEDIAGKTHIVVGWLLGVGTELEDLFKAQLLSSLLLDTSASPLLRALETSKLGSAPSPLCGLEDSSREMSFMAGLEGCAPDATADVERLVLATLERVKRDGIPEDQVEAALHQLELNQREVSGDIYPYGLQLILTGLSTAVHRGDPIRVLDMDPVLESLRREIKNPRFIPGLADELLLSNPHRVTLTLRPDRDMNNRKAAAEKARLATIRRKLSPRDITEILSRSKRLSERQHQVDNPELLPRVGLEDIPGCISEPPREAPELPGNRLPVSFYRQGTNGIGYQQVVYSLPALSQELLDVLPLYAGCIPELGVGSKDYAQVQTWQAGISGGLNCFSSIRGDIHDEQTTLALLSFSSKALNRNHGAMSGLLRETIAHIRFDEDRRLQELVEQICARKENSITQQGHSLAMNLACSRMSPAARLIHQSGGLEGIRGLRALRAELESAGARQRLLQQFSALHTLIQEAPRQFLLIGEPDCRTSMLEDVDGWWGGEAAAGSTRSFSLAPVREPTREIWTTTTQVNFCAQAFPTVTSAHGDNAVLHVLAGFLRNGFLHRAIREQGGAYGAGASQDANAAAFRFFSYRDPRLTETLQDFQRAVQWVISEDHPGHLLEEAILGVIGAMDKPSSPAGEAKQAFYNHQFGRTLELRMEFRRRVLETSLADLKRVAERYLTSENFSLGIIGSRESADCLAEYRCSVINL